MKLTLFCAYCYFSPPDVYKTMQRKQFEAASDERKKNCIQCEFVQPFIVKL